MRYDILEHNSWQREPNFHSTCILAIFLSSLYTSDSFYSGSTDWINTCSYSAEVDTFHFHFNQNYSTMQTTSLSVGMFETCFTSKHTKFNSFTSSFWLPKRAIHPFSLCSRGTLKYLLKKYTFHTPDRLVKLIANHAIQKYNICITRNVPSCGKVLLKVQFSLFWIFPFA